MLVSVCLSYTSSSCCPPPPPPIRFLIAEYVLDLGFVVHGQILSRDVRITNTGPVSVSFSANHKPLVGTGTNGPTVRGANDLTPSHLREAQEH